MNNTRLAFAALVFGGFALGACTPVSPGGGAVDDARATIRPVISEAVGDGPQATRATECIVQNAGNAEIADLAQAAGRPADGETTRLIFVIAQRPPAVTCLQQAAA